MSLKQVSLCPTTDSTDVITRLFRKLKLRPSAQFSCYQLLITKLSITIYTSAIYKQTIVSMDVITQPMQVGHNLLHHCLQEIAILVDIRI